MHRINTFLIFIIVLSIVKSPAQTPQWDYLGLDSVYINDIAIDDSANVYVASHLGIYKSTDNGATWVSKNKGLEVWGVSKIFIDYTGNIYLACFAPPDSGCGLYKSNDGGNNWIPFADTLNHKPHNSFSDVTIIPNKAGGFIYVSSNYGVYRSTDNGVTWEQSNFTHYLANDIGMNKNGYMFFANNTASWFGIYRSTDLGLTWDLQTSLAPATLVYLRDGSMLAGTYDPWLGSNGIYKTTDNGNNWINTNSISGLDYPSDFVLDTNDDIYVYVSGLNYDGVYLSTENGNYWSTYGLSGHEVTCLAIDSSGYIWAGANMDGMYRSAGRTVPVELASFTADLSDNNVSLRWTTVTETNNKGFEVQKLEVGGQRSEVGSQSWQTIGFVEGNGTATNMHSYSFIDKNITSGTYKYRLKQIDFDGSFTYSNEIEVKVKLPLQFSLSQNYPNPFNPSTNINYTIPKETFVTIKLYNITGREVKGLVNEKKQPGEYTIKLKGGKLSSGVYFYRLTTGSGYTAVKKLIILK